MMNRRNAKILVLGALLVLALPVVASASTSRVEGMALQGDFLKDYSNIYTYTSQVANVGNLVYGELGTATTTGTPPSTTQQDRSVGAVLGNLWEGRLGTWAVHVREEAPQLGQGTRNSTPAPGEIGHDPNTNPYEAFDLMWAKKFGTSSFGLRLNRAHGQSVVEATGVTTTIRGGDLTGGDNLSRNSIGVGAGVGFELSPTSSAEFNLLWQNRKWLEETKGVTTSTDEQDGANAYQLAARAMWQWEPNVLVIPVFKFYNFDLGRQEAATGVTTSRWDNSQRGWQVGVGGNWTLGSDDLFVLGVNVVQNKIKQQETIIPGPIGGPVPSQTNSVEITETLAPQVFAALESQVNSWLTLRFGASKAAWSKVKAKGATGPTVELTGGQIDLDSTFDMSLGAGVKVGNLMLDAIVHDDFVRNGPNFVSGGTTDGMFTKVTATYPW